MSSGQLKDYTKGMILLFVSLINIIVLRSAFIRGKGYWLLLFTLPLLVVAWYALRRRKP